MEVAAHKLKPAVRQVVWLGIKVDLNENSHHPAKEAKGLSHQRALT